ncbi:MAG: hypothetical protein V7676_02955 [Parasphingorhabdus sp.]|uniref:hypothetical protein n=1 Tax=Parasphingorhabdus sp. TaxID=2709688 RepID=UPI003001BE67
MTAKKKMGRPNNIERARQDIAHRKLLDQKCAHLGILMDRITDGEIAENEAAIEFGQIAEEIKDFEFELPKRGKNISGPNTDRLALLERLAMLQGRRDNQEIIAHWISNVISDTNFEITRVKQQLLHSVKDQRQVFSYQHKLLQKFEVAGITKHNASQISISDLKVVLNKAPTKPISKVEADEVVNNEPNNYSVWSDFLNKDHQQYSITAAPISSINNRGLAQNLENGDYPPFMDLADYNQPDLLPEFNAAKLPQDQKNIVFKICREWLIKTYGERKSLELWKTRKDTWPFMLALKYNFAHEIPDMRRVQLPGKEPRKTFLLAKCR